MPAHIDVDGRCLAKARVFKNDFFAVTALYEGEGRRVILKVQRQASFLYVPLGWVGRILAAKEVASLERLGDLDGIPRLLRRWDKTGIVREYVDGVPLTRDASVPDDFFDRLRGLVGAIHARDMAYVDLEKCENVLLGDDGLPHLIDFQIAWYWPRRLGGDLWLIRRVRSWFQAGDRYHLIKLQRRTRPDQLSPEALAASYRKPWYVRAHWILTSPFTLVRRAVLNRVDPRRGDGERGGVHDDTCLRET